MWPRFILCSVLLSAALPTFAQTARIDGVSEPPELSGEPKKVTKPPEALEQLFEIIDHLGTDDAEAKIALAKLDEFLKQHPDYSDGYFLRATFNACTLNGHDFNSITSDVQAAMSHPGEVYNQTDYYSPLYMPLQERKELILFGESSLRRALQQYLLHYHEERNHQGKGNRILFPFQTEARRKEGAVQCRERLGGLLRYYEREAA